MRSELKKNELLCSEYRGKCSALESVNMKALSEQEKRSHSDDQNKHLMEEKKVLHVYK